MGPHWPWPLAQGAVSSQRRSNGPELGCLGVLSPPFVLMCTQRQILLFIYLIYYIWLGQRPQTPRSCSSDTLMVALGALCAWSSSWEQGQLQLFQLWAGLG